MYQNVKRTCRVLFWLIKPIVSWRSRRRRRLSLLKLPIMKSAGWFNSSTFAKFMISLSTLPQLL